MGAITIGAALFADLIFLPPLLARFAPRTVAAGSFTGEIVAEDAHPDGSTDALAESQA